MIREKRLTLFLGKAALLLVLLGLPVYLLGLVPGMQSVNDPRKFLFAQKDFSSFNYAIIGDSVFCSYYVDSDKETMWAQFEQLTGKRCFPAALNGATIADMTDAAEYLARRLPPGSTVFVGLIPSRFVGKGIVRHRNYFNDFDQLKKSSSASFFKRTLDDFIDFAFQGFLLYREPYSLETFMRKKKGTFDTGYKTWDKAAWQKANQQYRTFVESQKKVETYIDTVALTDIRESLAARGITAVFVLSALNQGLIREFSSPEEAMEFIDKFSRTKNDLVAYFDRSGVEYIDLFDRIDSDCFVDMVHLNTCGDAVMAQAFADYVSSVK